MTAAKAHQPSNGAIHATAGPFGFATQQLSREFESPFLGSLGVVIEGDVDNNGGLEISIFYLPKKTFSIERENLLITEESKRLHITMGYRHWFNKKFSTALAFFSSYAMGDSHVVQNEFYSLPAPKTSASDATEYGFDFSLQYEPYSYGRFSAVFDVRYSYSVTPKDDEDSNHYGILLGIKYFIQGKDDPSED